MRLAGNDIDVDTRFEMLVILTRKRRARSRSLRNVIPVGVSAGAHPVIFVGHLYLLLPLREDGDSIRL